MIGDGVGQVMAGVVGTLLVWLTVIVCACPMDCCMLPTLSVAME